MELLIFHSIFNLNRNKNATNPFHPFSSTFFNEMKWSTRPRLHPRLGPIPLFILSSLSPLSLVFPGKDDVFPIYQIMADSRIPFLFLSFRLTNIRSKNISFRSPLYGAYTINIKYLTITLNYFKSLCPVHSLQLLNCL